MSFPEYQQTAEDHTTFTILLRPIGSKISKENFSKLHEKLRTIRYIKLSNLNRLMIIRFKLHCPPENNDWGDFQYHRKVLALICLARVDSSEELADIEKHYTDLKDLYENTLIDSRLILIGLKTRHEPMKSAESENLVIYTDYYNVTDGQKAEAADQLKPSNQLLEISEIIRSQVLVHQDIDEALIPIQDDLNELCQSLFFILESKRLTLAKSPSLLLETPCERMRNSAEHELDSIGIGVRSKPSKNQYYGRLRKHIGDICMMVNMHFEAFTNYQAAQELLRLAEDELWLAAACEGLAISSILLIKQQSSSATASPKQSTLGVAALKDGMKSALRKNYSSNELQLSPKLAHKMLSATTSFNSLDLAGGPTKTRVPATIEDSIQHYKEAINHYSKFPTAAIIEMEACLKATRVCIEYKKKQSAAEFLHHLAYVNMDEFSYRERTERYDVMGALYEQLNYLRKAAFFKRIAAMHCVNPHFPNPAWLQCIELLMCTFHGFKLSLNAADYRRQDMVGWPAIRLKIFQELIYAARQAKDTLLVIRLLSLCLHVMYEHMSTSEVTETVRILENSTNDTPDIGQAHVFNRRVIPHVTFTCLPHLSNVEVIRLPPHLEPERKDATPINAGLQNQASVFIYSPLINRQERTTPATATPDFCWAEGSPGSVDLYLYNPLSVELLIEDFSLITEGIVFQYYPSSHSLPAVSGPNAIRIVGTPRSHGNLTITGYALKMFGVRSQCLFSDLNTKDKMKAFIIDVSPALPVLSIETSLRRSRSVVTGGDSNVTASAIWQLYAGERKYFEMKLKNTSSDWAVGFIDIQISSDAWPGEISQLILHNFSSSSLPLAPLSESVVTLTNPGGTSLEDVPHDAMMGEGKTTPMKNNSRSSAVLDARVNIIYTGISPEERLYRRRCVLYLDIILAPSIEITSNDIECDAGVCLVTLGVLNASNITIEAESLKLPVVLKPMQNAKVIVLAKKCPLYFTTSDLVDHLRENVKVAWRSADGEHSGYVGVSHLAWNEDQLRRLRIKPFNVTVFLQSLSPEVDVRTPVPFTLQVENMSTEIYHDVTMSLTVVQIVQSERKKIEAGDSFVFYGPRKHRAVEVGPGKTLSINSTLIMFYPGQYILDCECTCGSIYLNDEKNATMFTVS